MHITAVNVVVVFGVKESTEEKLDALENFAEKAHDKMDEPLYEDTNRIVKQILANAKKLGIGMRNKTTPQCDFSINVEFRANDKAIRR